VKITLLLCIALIVFLIAPLLHAAQSTITDIEGSACMGDDKSRKRTEQAAITDATRRAVEFNFPIFYGRNDSHGSNGNFFQHFRA